MLSLAFAMWLGGCANPGQPKPPSLGLPQVVQDLAGERTGEEVRLHWMTPATTTDNLPVKGRMTAVLCRGSGSGGQGDRTPCVEFARIPVHPGPSEAVDTLPSGLTAGPAELLRYRVEVLNGQGRSAGRSGEVFAASGAAPAPIAGLRAAAFREGVRLTWTPDADATADTTVQLERVETSPPPSPPKPGHAGPAGMKLPGSPKRGAPTVVHLSVGAEGHRDPGGAVDRSVRKGASYRYVARRMESPVLAGHTLSIRSLPSASVAVAVLDTFPPQPPSGLEAAASGAQSLSIDLSWRPGVEEDLAGYNVYRAESEGGPEVWHQLNRSPLQVPAYTDTTAVAGRRYRYRVTAVDETGNESGPSAEVQETAGTR